MVACNSKKNVCSLVFDFDAHPHRFVLEMHSVFYRTDFPNINTAARSADLHALLVVAVLFEIMEGDPSPLLDFTAKFSEIAVAGQKVEYDFGAIPFTNFLPDNLDKFYSFDGSLTTPPCSPVTLWVVFDTVKKISKLKMGHFGHILDIHGAEVTHNYRDLQDLKGRNVYVYTLNKRTNSFGIVRNSIPRAKHRRHSLRAGVGFVLN